MFRDEFEVLKDGPDSGYLHEDESQIPRTALETLNIELAGVRDAVGKLGDGDNARGETQSLGHLMKVVCALKNDAPRSNSQRHEMNITANFLMDFRDRAEEVQGPAVCGSKWR